MFRIIQGLFLFCVFASGLARATPLQDCNALASELNKMTPMQVDKITLWKTTACLPQGRTPVLTYFYLLDVDQGQINKRGQAQIINGNCSCAPAISSPVFLGRPRGRASRLWPVVCSMRSRKRESPSG